MSRHDSIYSTEWIAISLISHQKRLLKIAKSKNRPFQEIKELQDRIRVWEHILFETTHWRGI